MNNQPQWKSKLTLYWSFGFDQDIENPESSHYSDPIKAISYLRHLLSIKTDEELIDNLELFDSEYEEFEDEGDPDFAPGGKDYD